MDGLESLVSLLEIMVIIFAASSFLILCYDVFQVIFAPSLIRRV